MSRGPGSRNRDIVARGGRARGATRVGRAKVELVALAKPWASLGVGSMEEETAQIWRRRRLGGFPPGSDSQSSCLAPPHMFGGRGFGRVGERNFCTVVELLPELGLLWAMFVSYGASLGVDSGLNSADCG